MGKNGNGIGHKVSTKNESTCSKCGRTFWRWDSKRRKCLLCEPLTPLETQRVLKAAGCDQPEVVLAPQEVRGPSSDYEKSSDALSLKKYTSRILKVIFATAPS